MNLRRIKHTLLRLTAEEKVIGIGSLAILFGTLMPWYSVVMNFDKKTLTETGFSGDLGVIGFVVFIMGLISILVLIGENMQLPLPQFGYKREQILFFFLGESSFITLLTMAIYTKRSLDFTEAGLRFGIYLVLLGAFFGALSAFALIQKTKKKEVSEFFSHEQEEEEEKDESLSSVERVQRTPRIVEEEPVQQEPEPMYFEEDSVGIEAIEEDVLVSSDYIPEEEKREEVQEPPKSQANQSNYFKREAGFGKAEDKPKTRGGGSMGFYEDK
jgi:hypothetical protein